MVESLDNAQCINRAQAIEPWSFQFVISHVQLQEVLSVQPFARMRRFAEQLGWRGLRLEYFRLWDDNECPEITQRVVIYYITTDEKFNLQINTQPHGQTRVHSAVVKAQRHGIIHTPWQDFELFEEDALLQGEVERLRPWLYRENFKNRAWRRRMEAEHPLMFYPRKRRGRPKN